MGIDWTKQEEEILKKLYESNVTISAIQKVLPSRTWSSIAKKAKNMGLRRIKINPEVDMKEFHRLLKTM